MNLKGSSDEGGPLFLSINDYFGFKFKKKSVKVLEVSNIVCNFAPAIQGLGKS